MLNGEPMTIQEQRRKAFEEAFKAAYGFGRLAAAANPDAFNMIRAAEWAWNAALDSVCVELPDIKNYEHLGDLRMRDAYVYDLFAAIHAAGVKTK
jgi:hypothetical protein